MGSNQRSTIHSLEPFNCKLQVFILGGEKMTRYSPVELRVVGLQFLDDKLDVSCVSSVALDILGQFATVATSSYNEWGNSGHCSGPSACTPLPVYKALCELFSTLPCGELLLNLGEVCVGNLEYISPSVGGRGRSSTGSLLATALLLCHGHGQEHQTCGK